MNLLRLVYLTPVWIAFLAFRTFMILLGWLLVPLAVWAKAYKPYTGQDGVGNKRLQYRFTWWFMYPWDNNEDGIADRTYFNHKSFMLQVIHWSCIRNPANNLRYLPLLSVKIRKEKIGYIGSLPKNVPIQKYSLRQQPCWYLCWHGLYSCLRIQFKLPGGNIKRFWIGWKLYPEDSIYEVAGHRVNGAGFATQFKTSWRVDQ